MSLSQILEALLLGGGVGLSSSFLGIGGGLLIVPLLPLIFSMSHLAAIATSLFTVFFVVCMNSFGFHLQKRVDWSFVFRVGPMVAISAFISAHYAPSFSEFSLKIFLMLLYLFIGFRISGLGTKAWAFFQPRWTKASWAPMLVGLMAGSLSGFAGVGSGIILTPFLVVTKRLRADMVAPSVNGVMCLSTLSAVLSFALKGPEGASYVHPQIGLVLFTGAMLTSLAGRRWQHRLSHQHRARLLVIVLLTVALKILFDLIHLVQFA